MSMKPIPRKIKSLIKTPKIYNRKLIMHGNIQTIIVITKWYCNNKYPLIQEIIHLKADILIIYLI